MRVALMAISDSGQQHRLLAKAMRNYLGWEAKSIVKTKTYLGYEDKEDWTLGENGEEAREFVKTADMLIFQDMLLDMEGLDLDKLAGHGNSIINGLGSMMREYMDILKTMQMEGWAVLPPLSDPTIAARIAGAPFENVIIPVDEILEITKGIEKNNELTICHAPTKTERKGTEIFEEILAREFPNVRYERITGKSWEDALRQKKMCHILLNSTGDESYGMNCLEGLILGQKVISNITPWDYALHSDLPMITTYEQNIADVVGDVIRNVEFMGFDRDEEERNIEWVRKHFGAETQIRKWEAYIEWVMTR
jgi:hypothetical protein